MKSHRVLKASETYTLASGANRLKIKKLIVSSDADAPTSANLVTLTVTSAFPGVPAFTMVFDATVGVYEGPFEFDVRQTVTLTTAADTVCLLEAQVIML